MWSQSIITGRSDVVAVGANVRSRRGLRRLKNINLNLLTGIKRVKNWIYYDVIYYTIYYTTYYMIYLFIYLEYTSFHHRILIAQAKGLETSFNFIRNRRAVHVPTSS
jgi:hypothetical protein